jgi:hypothetical protein
MKNVTITLDEKVAHWARVEAAKAGKSLSRWIGERLEGEMRTAPAQTGGLSALLALPEGSFSHHGKLPSRSEYYDRDILRRLERDHLHAGSRGSEKERKGD